ncbi:MAG TPA: T9SS type A sorting domain-containing protein, partial [Saprospiraceae bacterium]|nr:T9SS type A sorting domain-containing protein [Saprospiraceae bacterium]
PYAEAAYEVSTACIGSTLQLYGKGIGYFNWSGPNGFTSTQQHPTIPNVTTQNSGTYYLTVTSPNGCTATSQVVVTIHDLPALDMPVPYVEACEGSTVQLFADGEGSFSWSGPWGFASEYQNPVIYTIPAYMTGYYVVELQGQTGCVAKDSMYVQVGGYINADAWASPNPVCQGTTVKLHAEGGDYYLWTGPNGFTSTEQEPVIDNMDQNKEGTYGVLITSKEGCQTFLTVNVTMIPIEGEIWASANPNPISSQDRSFQLFSSQGTSYSWTGPNGFTSTLHNPIVRITGPQVAGLYVVTITLSNGCPAVAKVIVRYSRQPNGNQGFIDNESVAEQHSATQYVFPNPTNSTLFFSTAASGNVEYTIFNSQNKIVYPSQVAQGKYVNVEDLSSGVYYIRWKTDKETEWTLSKFVKIQ